MLRRANWNVLLPFLQHSSSLFRTKLPLTPLLRPSYLPFALSSSSSSTLLEELKHRKLVHDHLPLPDPIPRKSDGQPMSVYVGFDPTAGV